MLFKRVMLINSAICLCKLFVMDFYKQCENMICLKLSKPAEKLKLASNWNTINNCVWIPHLPLMVTEKSPLLLSSTEQFEAEGIHFNTLGSQTA